MGILRIVFFFLRGLLLRRCALAAENLALRQQVQIALPLGILFCAQVID